MRQVSMPLWGKKWAYWNHAQRFLLNDISWQWNLRQSVMRRHTPEVYSTAIQQGFWLSLNVHKLTCLEQSRHLMSSTVEYLNVLLFVLLLFVCFVTILHCGSHATKHAYKGTVWQCKKRRITSNKKAWKVYRNHDSVWYNWHNGAYIIQLPPTPHIYKHATPAVGQDDTHTRDKTVPSPDHAPSWSYWCSQFACHFILTLRKQQKSHQTQAKQHARPLHSRLELWNIKCQSNTCTVRSEYFIAHLPNYVRISEDEKSFDVRTVIFASLLSNPQKLRLISQTGQWNPLYMYAYRYIVTQLREINPRGRQSRRKFGNI